MSEQRDSDKREDDQVPTNVGDVETGNANSGPADSQSNEDRQPEEDFGAIAPTGTTSTTTTSDDAAGYFGPRHKRLVIQTLLLLWFSIFVIPRWSQYKKAPNDDWKTAFEMEVGGAVLILMTLVVMLGLICLETRDQCTNRMVKLVFTLILAFGGFLYWVGGILFADSVNSRGETEDKDNAYRLQGWAGAVFIESTFVFLLCLVLGMDYLTNFLSKSERIRIYLVFNTILTFTSVVGAFSYAAWRGYTTFYPIHVTADKTGCVSAGYFFILIACLYWYTFEFVDLCCRCSASAKRIAREKTATVKLIGVIILLFGGFLVMAGMWAIGSVGDLKWNCYYAGYGFFMLFFCLFMAFDLHLGRLWQQRK